MNELAFNTMEGGHGNRQICPYYYVLEQFAGDMSIAATAKVFTSEYIHNLFHVVNVESA